MKNFYYLILFFLSINFVKAQSPANCLNFDGQNDFVPLTNQIVLPNEFTIEAWIKTTVDGSILSGSDATLNQEFLFGIDNGKLRFRMVSNIAYLSFISNSIISDNNWHHVALTKNSSGLFSMYLDGVISSTQNSPSVPVIFSQIGTSMSLPNFNGSIDELRVWNVARTGTEINGAKDSELLCSNSGLVAYYQFNKGISDQINTGVTSLTDLTANDNNGTLTNFALTGTSSNWSLGSPVTSLSSPPTVVSPLEYAQNSTALALTGTTGLNGVSLLWYTDAIGGVGSSTLIPSTTSLGSTSYWVSSVNANGCESERAEIVVTVAVAASHLNFNGTTDYVDCGNILPASYTKEAWISINSLALNNNIISGSDALGQNAFWAPSGQLAAGHNGNWTVVQDVSTLALNTWYHVAVSYDSVTQTLNLYKNGILIATASGVPAPTAGNLVHIGCFNPGSNLFQGNIDEVRIWNTVRTIEQINSSKNCELQGNETGLVAYYQFNQGIDAANNSAITTLTDATSNGNNGTLTNFTLTGTTSNWLAGSLVGIPSVITLQPQDETVSETDPLTFSVNATGVNAYQWEVSFDGGTTWQNLEDTFTNPDVSGSTTNTVTISGSNMIGINGYKFRVILDGTSMCSIMSNEVLATVTLAVKSFGSNTVKVYPNPSTGIFTIDTQEEVEFAVYDVVGKTIVTQKSLIGSNNLDLSRFQKGIYLLKLMNSNGETNTHKLIKE